MTESLKSNYQELVGAKKLSWEEYSRIPYDGLGHHLIDGVHRIISAPSTRHQEISNQLSFNPNKFIIENKRGKVFTAPIDIKFSDQDGFQLDLLFIRQSRLDIIKDQYIEGSPDLIVEILSPDSDKADFGWKKSLVAKYKVSEYWVVDPFNKEHHQFTRDDAGKLHLVRKYGENDTLSPKLEIIRDLKFLIASIFELVIQLFYCIGEINDD